LYLLYLFHDTLSTADATFRPVSGMTKGAGADFVGFEAIIA